MKLSESNSRFQGIVKDVIDSEIASKLFEFGVLPGALIQVIIKAPFKGPVYVKIGDSLIALRRKEADNILVE